MSKNDDLSINLNMLDEKGVYEAFHVEGNEAEALTDSYFELQIDCPMKLYRAEYVADLAKQSTERRQRANIARAAGYSLKFIESVLQKRKKEDEDEKDEE